jgi:hypothetical protein
MRLQGILITCTKDRGEIIPITVSESMILLRNCRPKLGVLNELITQEAHFTPPVGNVKGSFFRE